MEQKFKEYLLKQGYKEWTPSGNPSTVYDYIRRIYFVLKEELLTWNELPSQINKLVNDYSIGGAKESLGAKSHNAVISALNRFCDFVATFKL